MNNLQPITSHRTQIYLEPWRYQFLKIKAQQENKSLAQVIREATDLLLKKERKKERRKEKEEWKKFMKLAGIIKKGPRDLSIKHDKFLEGALWEEYQKNQKLQK